MYKILHEYKIHNCEVLFREDASTDDLIDIIEGNRKYIKCLYVYNKIDVVSIEDVDRLARMEHSTVIACEHGDRPAVRAVFWSPTCEFCWTPLTHSSCPVSDQLNFDTLLARMWDYMGLTRVYTKRRGDVRLRHASPQSAYSTRS